MKDPKNAVVLPEGYGLEWSGEFEQMKDANERLMYIIPISLGLIMMLLYSMFNSVKDCPAGMVNVLEAAMGGCSRFTFTGTSSASRGPLASCRSSGGRSGRRVPYYLFNQMREGLRVRETVCAAPNCGSGRS